MSTNPNKRVKNQKSYPVSKAQKVQKTTTQDFSRPWHFSDLVLKVEGTRFHVHKSTLSMWSPVFERMFTSEFLESTASEIPLPGKKSDEFQVLLQFIYSNGTKQKLNDQNMWFLLQLADEYQMTEVKKLCSEFVLQRIGEHTCLKIYKNAEKLQLQEVMEQCIEEASQKLCLFQLERDNDFNELAIEVRYQILRRKVEQLE